jgi:hypothetical protein
MATAQQQARYRERDHTQSVQDRLDPAAVERLDMLVARRGAAGRGEIIERLLLAADAQKSGWLLNEAIRLGRAYLRATGEAEATMRDHDDWRCSIARHRGITQTGPKTSYGRPLVHPGAAERRPTR